jgi:hypothetical protein
MPCDSLSNHASLGCADGQRRRGENDPGRDKLKELGAGVTLRTVRRFSSPKRYSDQRSLLGRSCHSYTPKSKVFRKGITYRIGYARIHLFPSDSTCRPSSLAAIEGASPSRFQRPICYSYPRGARLQEAILSRAPHAPCSCAEWDIFARKLDWWCLTRGQLHSERLGQIQPSTDASFGSDVDRRQSHKCAPRRRLYCGEGSLQRSDPNLRRLNGHGPSRKHQALIEPVGIGTMRGIIKKQLLSYKIGSSFGNRKYSGFHMALSSRGYSTTPKPRGMQIGLGNSITRVSRRRC